MARHNSDITVPVFWKEYTSDDLGERIDLTDVEGAPPGQVARQVTLLEAGAVYLENAAGVECPITTSLDKGAELFGDFGAIMATQTAGLIVWW